MQKLHLFKDDIYITSSRRIDDIGFTRACKMIEKAQSEILSMEKSSVIILQDHEKYSFVIERMNTDTFTIHVQYEINGINVYQI